MKDGPAGGVRAMTPFLPAKDFAASRRFYGELGATIAPVDDRLLRVMFGPFAFFLQDYYVKDWAENCMIYLTVDDVDAWWLKVEAGELCARYRVRARAPRAEPWGHRVMHLIDPAGVLWHIGQPDAP